MFYTFGLTVPANIAESSPVEQELKLAPGVLHWVDFFFPWGCAGLAKAALYRFEQQLYPTNPGEWFAANDDSIEFPTYFPLDEWPYVLRLEAWNEDDTYSHTITVRLGVLPYEAYWKMPPGAGFAERVKRSFGL